MSKQPRVIDGTHVKISKRFGNGLCFEYRCPKCKEQLKSVDGDVLLSDTCPTCHRSFVFSEGVKEAWKDYVRRQQLKTKQALDSSREHSRFTTPSKIRSGTLYARNSSPERTELQTLETVGVQFRTTKADNPNQAGNAKRARSLLHSSANPKTLNNIFDWKIQTYITPWILRCTWVGAVACGLLMSLILTFSVITVWLPTITQEPPKIMLKDLQAHLAEKHIEKSQPPLLSPIFMVRAAKTCWILIQIIGVALAVLWIRVLLETGIVLFDISRTISDIHGSMKNRSTSDSIPRTAEVG